MGYSAFTLMVFIYPFSISEYNLLFKIGIGLGISILLAVVTLLLSARYKAPYSQSKTTKHKKKPSDICREQGHQTPDDNEYNADHKSSHIAILFLKSLSKYTRRLLCKSTKSK